MEYPTVPWFLKVLSEYAFGQETRLQILSAIIIYAHIITYCDKMTWEFEHSIETNAGQEEIWALYCNVESWPLWDHGIEDVSLYGEFREGTQGKIKPEGQGFLSYRITLADSDKGFSDETVIDNLKATIKFIHTFSDLPGGKIRLTNHVTILCQGKEEMEKEIGESITSGVPQTMENIARMAIFMEKICRSK